MRFCAEGDSVHWANQYGMNQNDDRKVQAVIEWPSSCKDLRFAFFSQLGKLLWQIHKGVFENCCPVDRPTQEREELALI